MSLSEIGISREKDISNSVRRAVDRLLRAGVILGSLAAGGSLVYSAVDLFGPYKQERTVFEATYPLLTADLEKNSQRIFAEYGKQAVDAFMEGQVIPTPVNQVIEARSVLIRSQQRAQKEEELLAPYNEKFERSVAGIGIGVLFSLICAVSRRSLKKY